MKTGSLTSFHTHTIDTRRATTASTACSRASSPPTTRPARSWTPPRCHLFPLSYHHHFTSNSTFPLTHSWPCFIPIQILGLAVANMSVIYRMRLRLLEEGIINVVNTYILPHADGPMR